MLGRRLLGFGRGCPRSMFGMCLRSITIGLDFWIEVEDFLVESQFDSSTD
jgi:hypothetical protein